METQTEKHDHLKKKTTKIEAKTPAPESHSRRPLSLRPKRSLKKATGIKPLLLRTK